MILLASERHAVLSRKYRGVPMKIGATITCSLPAPSSNSLSAQTSASRRSGAGARIERQPGERIRQQREEPPIVSVHVPTPWFWPGIFRGVPAKNGITIGGSAAPSISSLRAHTSASRRSGDGSPESGSQVHS
jgi:hypothetical protein